MSSKTYIIAWDKALDNCLDIDRQLSDAGANYMFLDVSSDNTERLNWVKSPDVRYYGHFYAALKDFMSSEHLVFGFNAGDPTYPNYAEIVKKAENVLTAPGIYAPNMAGDSFSEEGVFLQDSSRYPDLYLATQTNGICVYLHRDVAQEVYDFMSWLVAKGVDFSTMTSGWGLDTMYCVTAIYLNFPIYRDKDIYVYHPVGSSYQGAKAAKEMKFIDDSYIEYAASSRGWDHRALLDIRAEIFFKARYRESRPLKLEQLYLVNADTKRLREKW